MRAVPGTPPPRHIGHVIGERVLPVPPAERVRAAVANAQRLLLLLQRRLAASLAAEQLTAVEAAVAVAVQALASAQNTLFGGRPVSACPPGATDCTRKED